MSLLTPTNDIHTFPSYLPMDHHHNANSEWPMYPTHDLVPDIDVQGPESLHLTKATRDLMSLDADRWPSGSTVPGHGQNLHYSYYPQQQPQQYGRYDVQQQYQQQPRRNVTFPFLAPKQEFTQLHSLSINTGDANRSYSGLPTPTTASSSSNSSYNFNPSPMMASPTSPTHSVRLSRSPGLAPSIKRRSFDSALMQQQSNKRTRLTPPHSALPYSRPSASPAPVVSSKPPLLSPDQKKANHIQSEQKRRANIRRGYEALCDTVPALREAIRAEEDAANIGREKGTRSRRAKAKAKEDGTGEKIDGRAGPRSENVVLMKTIEYINDLNSERSDLLARLERAKSLLAPGHPALSQSETPALWEREWKGGAGSEGEDDEESE